jgi:hypothetical protein
MEYTRLETLTDCICRKCSMRATLRRLEQDAERLTAEAAKSSVSQSKKKRLREVKRFALRLKTALEEGRIEEDIKGIKIEKVFSRASTKQAMVARVSKHCFCSPSRICLIQSMLSLRQYSRCTSIARCTSVHMRPKIRRAYTFRRRST